MEEEKSIDLICAFKVGDICDSSQEGNPLSLSISKNPIRFSQFLSFLSWMDFSLQKAMGPWMHHGSYMSRPL